MLRRSNDYSFFDDKVFNQIAAAVNDQATVVHITQNKRQAVKTAKLLCNKGYESLMIFIFMLNHNKKCC